MVSQSCTETTNTTHNKKIVFSRFYTRWIVHTPDPFVFRVFWSWSNCGTFLSQSYTTTSHVIVWVVFTTTTHTTTHPFSRFYTNWTRLILTVLVPLLALIFFNTKIFTGIRSPCVVFFSLIFHDLQVTHSMWQVWSGHHPQQHDRHDHPQQYDQWSSSRPWSSSHFSGSLTPGAASLVSEEERTRSASRLGS